jgi:hypothetical protein
MNKLPVDMVVITIAMFIVGLSFGLGFELSEAFVNWLVRS